MCNNTIIHSNCLALLSDLVAYSSCLHIKLSTHCMLANVAADCASQLCVLCLLRAFLAKMPLLDLLQAFPAKLELVNSVLADATLPPQERALLEQVMMVTQQQADYGGRLNYQLLFDLKKPVAWDSLEKHATGFDEWEKMCCDVLCCAVLCCAVLCCLTCTMSARQCASTILTSFDFLLLLPLFLCCLHT
jgi:hypothetical protein